MGKAKRTSDDLPPLGSSVPVGLSSRGYQGAIPTSGEGRRSAGSVRPPAALSRPKSGFRTVLRNRYFLRLWVAQLISQTIMNAANYGLIILIAAQSGSVFATGGAIAAFSLPAALFGAPAGVMVDRFDKRRVLWMSNVLRGLASFGFVISLFIDSHALVPVYLLAFVIAMVGQFFAPAEGAAIPLLVDEDELVNALALFNITFTLSQALGLIVIGPLILAALPPSLPVGGFFHHTVIVLPVQVLFMVVSLLYLVCALLIVSIPHRKLMNRATPEHARPLARNGQRLVGIWAGVTECWGFIRHRPALLASVLQLSLTGTVLAIIAEIAPSFVRDFFHLSANYAALVFIPAGLGLVLGSIALPHAIKRVRRRSWLIAAGVITLSGCALLLTFVRLIAIYFRHGAWWQSWTYIGIVLVLTFLMGLGLDLVNIPAQTTMQGLSPDYIKGRVLALQMMLYNAATVPVVFLVGLAADSLGLPLAMDIVAVAILTLGWLTLYYAKSQRTESGQPSAVVDVRGSAPGNLASQSAAGPIAREPWEYRATQRSQPLGPRAADPVE